MITEEDVDACLSRMSDQLDIAVAISRQYALNQQILPQSKLYCFDGAENVRNFYVSLYIRKGHPLTREILMHLRQVHESGLINKWLSDSQTIYRFETPYLQAALLNGGLFMYILGTSMGISVFVAEIYTALFSQRRHAIWLRIFIDNERRFFIFRRINWIWIQIFS